jgi:hypothetical protein
MPESLRIRFTPPFFTLFTLALPPCWPFLPFGWLPKTICFDGSLVAAAFLGAPLEFSMPQGSQTNEYFHSVV